jgi:PEP-CTERM motif
MNKSLIASALLALAGAAPQAQAHELEFNVVTTWAEPETAYGSTVFEGRFLFDEHTHEVLGLHGRINESMIGTNAGNTVWLDLAHQLVTFRDEALGGTFAAAFKNPTTTTFFGNTWLPADGVAVGGIYAGWPVVGNNPGNAYALVFVPDNPTAALTQAQINRLAYADCAPGGMMGAVCMTGTSLAGHGGIGTMSGTPLSQVITEVPAAPVPEPGTWALMLGGLAGVGGLARKRKPQA